MTDCTHQTTEGAKNSRRLLLALGVIVTFMIVEIVGGVISGSLALLADATHMLTDALALGLAASAQLFAMRPADSNLHFGYRRAQVLAAFVNGILLTVLLVWIVIEAVQRFASPVAIDAPLMLWVAIGGLIANIIAFLILHRGASDDLNMRGAMLHVVGDLLGSVAAIVGAIVIAASGWVRIDPILSILVAALIGVSAIRLLKETGFILLEGAPGDVDTGKLAAGLTAASSAIKGVHHIRIWQITPDQPRITLHACVDRADEAATALRSAKEFLATEYGIHHSTIQIDVGGECPDGSIDQTDSTSTVVASSPAKDIPATGTPIPAHNH